MDRRVVTMTVNGSTVAVEAESRRLLSDVLRDELGLTGVHVGCEHGVCGACTVIVDGKPQRSCLLFAVQMEDSDIETVESLAAGGADLHPLQRAFWEEHGLQCGFCTPGILLTVKEFLARNPSPTEEEIRHALAGNICRCTGYVHIVAAVRRAAEELSRA
jgi:aerobic-type carbon monoxide dehydrogenase small subunit (CoxS/CutS family)